MLLLISALLLLAAGGSKPALAATPLAPHKLVYTVQHSTYGKLGTFTNTIQTSGDRTTVTTDAHYKIGAIGLTFYRQDVARVETWSGGRLMGFHGVTSVNGETVELDGKAEGDQFVLMTPEGIVTAPANVRMANPWSRHAVEGDIMLTPDRGRLETVTLTESEDATIRIGSKMVRTKHFAVVRGAGPRRYEIWLDDEDIPVQFSLVNPNNTVTFTLSS